MVVTSDFGLSFGLALVNLGLDLKDPQRKSKATENHRVRI
jgi:hypothetical protein